MIRLSGIALHDDAPWTGGGAIDLDIPDGAFRWLSGPTGSGKSSLLRVLALAARPASGSLSMFGTETTRAGGRSLAALRRRIGVVGDEPRLLDHLDALGNVALPLRLRGDRPGTARLDAAEMLDWVGLGARMTVPAARLSRGERQLCALARAVVTRPELLLADEPLAHLDAAEAARMFELLLEMNRLGATVLVATRNAATRMLHDAAEIRLDRGRVASARMDAADGRAMFAPPAPAPASRARLGVAVG